MAFVSLDVRAALGGSEQVVLHGVISLDAMEALYPAGAKDVPPSMWVLADRGPAEEAVLFVANRDQATPHAEVRVTAQDVAALKHQ